MIRFHPELTQIIFFDLEFWVPPEDRESTRRDLRANPYRPGHLLLGGTFSRIFPRKGESSPEETQFWLWNYPDEKALVEGILSYFQEAWDLSLREPDQCGPLVCGIGISRVDIGYLFGRAQILGAAAPEKLFTLLHHLRILELESLAIPYFKTKLPLLYPKSTAEINGKFLIRRPRESGKKVWDYYDQGDFQRIVDRNTQEVADFISVYTLILKDQFLPVLGI